MFVFSAPASNAVATSRRASAFLDQLFTERVPTRHDAARVPALDVAESDTAFTLAFEVPGVTREQLKVSVQGRRVQLSTELTTPAVPEASAASPEASADSTAERVLYRERAEARYARTVSLPAEVDAAGSAARFDNGILTLTLPKRVATGATVLSIG